MATELNKVFDKWNDAPDAINFETNLDDAYDYPSSVEIDDVTYDVHGDTCEAYLAYMKWAVDVC